MTTRPPMTALNGRVPRDLYLLLEELRHRRSQKTGRRWSQRELLVEALAALVEREARKAARGRQVVGGAQ